MLNMLIFNSLQASAVASPLPPGCDTLITTDGSVLLVRIESQNKREIKYSRCDDKKGLTYVIRVDKVREWKRYTGPPIVEEKELPIPPPAPKRPPVMLDTFDLLTLKDGHKYRVRILAHDYFNTYYRLYDQPADDREYYVPNEKIRSVRMAKNRENYRGMGNVKVALIVAGIVILLMLVL